MLECVHGGVHVEPPSGEKHRSKPRTRSDHLFPPGAPVSLLKGQWADARTLAIGEVGPLLTGRDQQEVAAPPSPAAASHPNASWTLAVFSASPVETGGWCSPKGDWTRRVE
jgi:hypothetical protein